MSFARSLAIAAALFGSSVVLHGCGDSSPSMTCHQKLKGPPPETATWKLTCKDKTHAHEERTVNGVSMEGYPKDVTMPKGLECDQKSLDQLKATVCVDRSLDASGHAVEVAAAEGKQIESALTEKLDEHPSLSDWASHGELMDETELAKSALSDEMIAQLNAADGMTWTAGRNTIFEHATLKFAKVLMGTLQNKNSKTFLPYKAPEVQDMPAEFDWRTDPRAANCPSLKEIRDQANCGSCWAFGSVEAMTDRICLASKGQDRTHLSAEDVTSCDKLGDMGCSGGIPSTVYTYYRMNGIVDGGNYGDKSGCYSYQPKPCAHHSTSAKYANCTDSTNTPACARKCVDNGNGWASSKHHGLAGNSVCQQGSSCPDAMMQEIYKNGPITGMFFVHQSFLAYKSGVYKAGMFFKDPMLGGHAIKIIGWGTENGNPYWLVANSWNEDWGDHGFFKIDRGHNQCQIENAMINGGPVAGMPKLSDNLLVV